MARGFGNTARRVGSWGRKRDPMTKNVLNRRGKVMSAQQRRASGYRRMGGAAALGGVTLNRKSSGSRGAPPAHSSGGHMFRQ